MNNSKNKFKKRQKRDEKRLLASFQAWHASRGERVAAVRGGAHPRQEHFCFQLPYTLLYRMKLEWMIKHTITHRTSSSTPNFVPWGLRYSPIYDFDKIDKIVYFVDSRPRPGRSTKLSILSILSIWGGIFADDNTYTVPCKSICNFVFLA